MAMAMEAKSGGRAVRRPLQPRDSNVASPVVAVAAVPGKAKAKARTRLAATATASPPSVRSFLRAESRVEMKEVSSLAEELEKARERRGRLRAAREVTERALEEREEVLRVEAREWERRADEQSRLVAELMRLLGMPEVSTSAFLFWARKNLHRFSFGLGSIPFDFVATTVLDFDCLLDAIIFRGRCILQWSR